MSGPERRATISNRIFNDVNQNMFSERGVTQWGFVWGQFLDHTFGLREAPASATARIRAPATFRSTRPTRWRSSTNDTRRHPVHPVERAPRHRRHQRRASRSTPSAPTSTPGPSTAARTDRLEWLREGPVDGNLANNGARLLLPDGYLPRRDARGNPATAPAMDVDGRLRGQPEPGRGRR